jgi:hypothetical protein
MTNQEIQEIVRGGEMSDIQDEAYSEAMDEIKELKVLVYKLACELDIYHNKYSGRAIRKLLSPEIDALLEKAWKATK